ncbi:hypothetical protein [Microbacterium sp. ZKA21]|uniref:WXG100-like domain-containing protein n=1 Tax=Microbacterium sp. ZKA21 TaxID=3381694 RepID=UPI003D1B655E
MMLPNELIWIMEKLGFEWPDVDEDELRRAGDIIGTFTGELEGRIQAVDRQINGDMAAAMRGQAGPAFVAAWNSNRSGNLQQLLDALGPAPVGLDIAAGVVVGLKVKVIADITTTAIALVAMLTNPITAAGSGLMLIAKKKLLNAAVEIALEQALEQILPMVIEPLVEQLPGLVMAALDAPLVEGAVGDSDEFYADLQALEQAESDLDLHASDIDELIERLGTDLAGLNITGD